MVEGGEGEGGKGGGRGRRGVRGIGKECTVYCIYTSITNTHPALGKILIIGGGIANFTNVAATFKVRMIVHTPHILYIYTYTVHVASHILYMYIYIHVYTMFSLMYIYIHVYTMFSLIGCYN